MMRFAYCNGRIVNEDKVKIEPYDLGLLRGYAVFDVMLALNFKPLFLAQHYKRLKNSAKLLGLKLPFDEGGFKELALSLLKKNRLPAANVRTLISGGVSKDGFSPGGRPTVIILISPFVSLPGKMYQRGAKIITLEFERYLPEAKTTNYVAALMNIPARKKAGAVELLLVKNGRVYECSTSSIAMVKNGRIIVPEKDVLAGITAMETIKLARRAKLPVDRRNISIKELLAADEVYLTATNKHIMPVVMIDKKKIANGKVGPITKELMSEYDKLIKE